MSNPKLNTAELLASLNTKYGYRPEDRPVAGRSAVPVAPTVREPFRTELSPNQPPAPLPAEGEAYESVQDRVTRTEPKSEEPTATAVRPRIRLNRGNAREGFLYAEIFGAPVSRRKRY